VASRTLGPLKDFKLASSIQKTFFCSFGKVAKVAFMIDCAIVSMKASGFANAWPLKRL